ncbi:MULTISPECIES: peptidase inhibitor family I36 protein [Actinomadura]|uniref:Peptidase inhibitor family I36 protein n=1 Tax=Actinomadura yumaensis TaxID=111807 RepID=A0ABW2CHA1_9ACTN|nr:hypothetical protein [Actinomadura sp. J1-007]
MSSPSASRRRSTSSSATTPAACRSAPTRWPTSTAASCSPSQAGSRSAAADPCATVAYCFYDGANFTSRKLTSRGCGGWQYLTDYGFGNKTSSWTNATRNTVQVYDEEVTPRKHLWTESPSTASANVGTTAYNKADSFLTYCPPA